MLITVVLAIAMAAILGARLLGSRPRSDQPARSEGPGPFVGPNTLEELFATRYARGDIDGIEYRSCVDDLARQLHC